MSLCFSIIFILIYYSINVSSSISTNCISIITISAYWVKSFPSPQTSVQMTSPGVLLMSIRTPIGLFWNPFTVFQVGFLKIQLLFLCKILHEKQKLDGFDLEEQLQLRRILEQKCVKIEKEQLSKTILL